MSPRCRNGRRGGTSRSGATGSGSRRCWRHCPRSCQPRSRARGDRAEPCSALLSEPGGAARRTRRVLPMTGDLSAIENGTLGWTGYSPRTLQGATRSGRLVSWGDRSSQAEWQGQRGRQEAGPSTAPASAYESDRSVTSDSRAPDSCSFQPPLTHAERDSRGLNQPRRGTTRYFATCGTSNSP